jgi:hypothetical protein
MEGARIQSTPTMVTPVDADRALRLRENKRRNRQRQKDYTAELESRLRRLESEGIKATQEVQSAARKVVEDNSRLKALLRFKGVDEHTISTWTPEGETAVSDVSMPTRHGRCTTVCLAGRLAAIVPALNRLGNNPPPFDARKLAFAT